MTQQAKRCCWYCLKQYPLTGGSPVWLTASMTRIRLVCIHSAHAMLLQEVVDDPTGNKMLLVMDYMEGGPVMTRDALEKGRCIPEPLALQYFRDMLKASQACGSAV